MELAVHVDTHDDKCAGPGSWPSSQDSPIDTLRAEEDSSPFRFLRAAMPHVADHIIFQALENYGYGEGAGGAGGEVEMERVVEDILTTVYLQEVEERGVGSEECQAAAKQDRSKRSVYRRSRKDNNKRYLSFSMTTPQPPSPSPIPNTWARQASIADHLSTLLPPHPPQFFLSYFHSPRWRSTYDALVACLKVVSSQRNEKPPSTSSPSASVAQMTTDDACLIISELITPVPPDMMMLAVRATQQRIDDALSLIEVLRDLHLDSQESVTAGPCKLVSAPRAATQDSPKRKLELSYGPTRADASNARSLVPSSSRLLDRPHRSSDPSESTSNQWQSTPIRNHPCISPSSSSHGRSSPSPETRSREYLQRRDELLREAVRAWKAGGKNGRNFGAEVAAVYAQRVRFIYLVEATQLSESIFVGKGAYGPGKSRAIGSGEEEGRGKEVCAEKSL
jgi:hypothetical protein